MPCTAVRSGAGTPQVPCTAVKIGAGTPQVPCTAVSSGAGTLQVPCTAVSSGAKFDLQRLTLSLSQSAPLRNFLFAPARPIEKVTLWVGFLYLTPGSETDEVVAKDNFCARAGNRTWDSGSKAQHDIH